MEKDSHLVAVIYPQAGGFVARILPPGITCFSENLEGLQLEIKAALEKYSEDIDEMADAAAGPPRAAFEADWENAEDESTVFLWNLDQLFPH